MSYQKYSSRPWLVVRRKGKGLVHTVPQERYRPKRGAGAALRIMKFQNFLGKSFVIIASKLKRFEFSN